jgi:two-component system LytT family response regulator
MRVLIIEDEDRAADRLARMLGSEIPGIQITGPIDSVKEAIAHLNRGNHYDLIFLDIELADGKCFSIFEQVQCDIPVIFTTAYDEYALKAFGLNSIDYLLKPVGPEELHRSLEKFGKLKEQYRLVGSLREMKELLSGIQQQGVQVYQNRFLVSKGDAMLPIKTSEVAYFFAEDKAVFLYTISNARFLLYDSLDELERKLDPALFFRANRQFMVSSSSILKVHHHFNYKLRLILSPEPPEEVIISKARASAFKEWMMR